MRSSLRISVVLACVLLGHAAVAHAAWTAGGSGSPTTKAVTMPAGNTPTASVSNRSVTVSWTASSFSTGGSVSGYVVKRYDTAGNVQTIGSGCSGTISTLTCTETAVPGGTWKYSVTPVHANWTGTESAQSASVTVAPPSLSFSSSTTVTALPATLSGSIAGFVGGQTVTFRLDDPSTGTVLSGNISPTPVPSGGGSTVSVTVPPGTPNGAHTVYAVGSSGDVASAALTVAVTYTATMSAWDFRDASSGTEANVSAASAFANDGLTFATGNWSTAFSTTRYVDFDLDAPLPGGFTASGGSFNLNLAAGAAGDTACLYFDVRRASTGAVVATHGSSGTPVACVTGTTLQPVATSLPELTTTDLTNDLRVRVYVKESGSRPVTVDLASITGTSSSTAFTLYANSYTDASTGTASAFPWALLANGDGASYNTSSNWPASPTTSQYLKLTFPAYLWSGATVTGATFSHSYRANRSGNNACYYAEVYSGATLIGTHGSAASPVSCNSTSTFKTDPIPLPEVNTVARANSVVVKLYFSITGSANKTTVHDYTQLSVSYK